MHCALVSMQSSFGSVIRITIGAPKIPLHPSYAHNPLKMAVVNRSGEQQNTRLTTKLKSVGGVDSDCAKYNLRSVNPAVVLVVSRHAQQHDGAPQNNCANPNLDVGPTRTWL